MATRTPIDVARVEHITEAHLPGASRFEVAAFGMAVLEFVLDAQVEPWTAIAVISDAGTWREVVAERCWLQ